MVTFLITSALVLALFAIAIYFWQKPANKPETIDLPPAYPATLFSEVTATPELTAPENHLREDLLARAKTGDFDVLLTVKGLDIYAEVLDQLISSNSEILTLASFVAERNLRANRDLVNAVTHSWEANLNSPTTAQMLHIAALSDDGDVYDTAIQRVLKVWRAGKLLDVSAVDLQALFNSEFWLLSSEVRNSGTGFILKRTSRPRGANLKAYTTK